MSHPVTNVQVHLAQHPDHTSAVTATLTGADTYLARALLTTHGFRQADTRTMILVRIDHEEPYYTDRAAHALRQDGITVEIDPGLQEAIDTEWTWANYPMHWLNREEIRGVSDDAQKIHDDIAAGCLTIHLQAHDGWTIVAVGTYRDVGTDRDGQSVHLHGEDHLRVIASVYESPARAIAEFQRLNGESVRPGPAPTTHTERAAAELLATTTRPGAPPTDHVEEAPRSEQARTELVPVYAADPGNHESLTLRAEFVHDTGPGDTNWTIAAYKSPIGDRTWHATATTGTPVEIVHTLLDTLASATARGLDLSDTVSAQTIAQATRPLTDSGWKQTAGGRWITWSPPNGDAAGVRFDAFAAQDRALPAWLIWGGNTADRPAWALHASPHTPVIALQALTFELSQGEGHRHLPTARGRHDQSAPAPAAPPPLYAASPPRPR
ncbi:DUF317 domain-containing protein [Streptomyces sp. NPDC006923]|uniref:DUF317 domain-containing protein n=1 Tax=Streptomyces sp. NPDC006923 TaxID=3155355 RepID=UPI0033FDAD4E